MEREADTGKRTFSRIPVRLKHEGTKRPKYSLYNNGMEKKKKNPVSIGKCVYLG